MKVVITIEDDSIGGCPAIRTKASIALEGGRRQFFELEPQSLYLIKDNPLTASLGVSHSIQQFLYSHVFTQPKAR